MASSIVHCGRKHNSLFIQNDAIASLLQCEVLFLLKLRDTTRLSRIAILSRKSHEGNYVTYRPVFSREYRIVSTSYQDIQQCSGTGGSRFATSGGSHVSNIVG